MIEHVDRWCELLADGSKEADGWTAPKDMGNWSDYLVFDVLLDLCFGKSLRIKEPANDELKSFPHLITNFVMFYCRVGSTKMPLCKWCKETDCLYRLPILPLPICGDR